MERKLTNKQVRLIRLKYDIGISYRELSKEYDVPVSTIHSIINMKSYKDVEDVRDSITNEEIAYIILATNDNNIIEACYDRVLSDAGDKYAPTIKLIRSASRSWN